jgi:alpha-amylase
VLLPGTLLADIPELAPGIPQPEQRNVIVQLFNWKFNDIKAIIPDLKKLGYSHIHVSPPQKSNEKVSQWWGRYQPVDYSTISGPLGSEAEFKQMNDVADANAMQIIVDTVLNHTVDVTEQPDPPFIVLSGDVVSKERFPQFEPQHFHKRCDANSPSTEQTCWLSNNLADLNTQDSHVRQVAKDYLKKLAVLGVDGYRFDAAIHVEPGFYSEVLSVVPGKFAFGEIIKDQPSHFKDWIAIPEMDFYDFPLTKTMQEAFAPGGDLTTLKNPKAFDKALEGPKAIAFVRNHDIDRGQANNRGIEDANGRQKFGIGWNETAHSLERTDVYLAYAYLFGREDGLPYVFVDMPSGEQDDRYDDEFIVAGIRFHNLCLASTGGVQRREEIWRIETPNVIGWQRGNDRFIVINKAGDWYEIKGLNTSLKQGEYKEVRTGWPLNVQSDGTIKRWNVPPRSAMMFVRVGG